LVKYNSKWYHVKDGIKTTATTVVKYNGKWYYVEKGKINWKARTVVKYNGKWFYVNKGKIDWNSKTVVKYNGKWYYVTGGKINWKSKTLVKYNGKLYYVNNGKIDWNTKTIVKFNGKKYYVKGGSAQTKFSGKIKIKDKTYNLKAKYLESGDIVLETTNLTKIENTNLVTKEEKKVLKYTPEIKSTQTVNSISTCHNIDDLDINVVEFKKGENFDTDTHKFYLEVTYLQYSVDSQFRTVYVDISKDMVKTSYSTASAFSTPRTVNIAYEGNYAQLNYYVVN
jgi:uncharacterized protein YlzI (FlbEa/FlbD family)